MAGRPRQTRIKQLSAKSDFLKKLVLNQWVLTRFGIDPLDQYRDKGSRVRPITLLSKALKESEPGLNQQAMTKRGEQLYLLRNLVKQGIGFFEVGGFYPDFILWHVHEDRQRIVFVDPHGLRHTGPKDEKIEFGERIKDVERRLKSEHVELESVILAPSSTTREWITSNWGMTAEELRGKHVLFMSDADYLDSLMQVVAGSVATAR